MKHAIIPDDLIIDNILPRLPVKSLLRFKSVCKEWRTTISTPQFKKSHLVLSFSRHQFVLPKRTITHPFLRIAGCCNGLVGLHSFRRGETQLFVTNPATTHRVDIYVPPDLKYSPECMYWFGYVSSIDDYKIVAYAYNHFWIFSFKTGIWSNKCNDLRSTIIYSWSCPTQVGDSLFWLFIEQDFTPGYNNGKVKLYIIELSLVSEEFEVKPKVEFKTRRRTTVMLFNWKGCLAIHRTSATGGWHDVWILKRKYDWTSWEKVHSKVHKGVWIFYFSNTGPKLVILANRLNRRKVVDDISFLPSSEVKYDDKEGDVVTDNDILWGISGDYYDTLIWPFRRQTCLSFSMYSSESLLRFIT